MIAIGAAHRERWLPPVVVDPIPGESPGGLLIRHCECNGWPTLRDFATQQGISIEGLRWGEGLQYMEDSLRLDRGSLADLDRSRTRVTATLFGERFPIRRLDGARRRLCIDCLDENRYQRQWWEFSFLDRCPVHNRVFTGICGCGRTLSWFDNRLDGCGQCGHAVVRSGRERDCNPSPFQEWFVGALEGRQAPVPLLKPCTLATAIDVVDRVGILVLGGYRTEIPHAWSLGVDPAAAMDAGFRALGGSGLGAAIAASVEQYRRKTGIEVPRVPYAALGWFGIWLHQSHLATDHPLRNSVWEALKAALGLPLIDIGNSGLIPFSELAVSHRTSVSVLEDMARSRGFRVHGSARARCVSVEFALGLKVPNVRAERRQVTPVEDAAS
jgi:hypothetical protein